MIYMGELMNKVTQMIVMLLVVISMVGCSQKEEASGPPFKAEDVKKEVKKSSNEDIVDNLVGTWLFNKKEKIWGVYTIDKSDNKLLMKTGDLIYEFELQDIKDNRVNAVLLKEEGGALPEPIEFSKDDAIEYTFILNDKNQLKMETNNKDEKNWNSVQGTKVTEVDDSNYKDITSQLVGNWINDEEYIRLSKRNGNLVMGLRDWQEDLNWENVVEVKGNANNTVIGVIVETAGEAEDLGMEIAFTLNEDGKLVLGDLSLSKTDMERETWEKEKELAKKELDLVFYKDDGTEINFKDFRGKKVVLLMWGTWVKPSVEMLSHLNEIYGELKEKNIVVYSISSEGNAAKDYVKENNMKVPNLNDLNGDFNLFLANEVLPSLYIYDEEGFRIETIKGSIDKDEMRKKILGD
jgi:peroxiredoxin